jgi:hypothetical protein
MLISKSLCLSFSFVILLMGASTINADVLYNTNGGNNLNGTDGQLPPSWVGTGVKPGYSGSMSVMWYANLTNKATTLSTADAIANGASADFLLGTGPKAWANVIGHGLDYGLIHLNNPSNLTVTVSADNSSLVPGFSLYQSWDSGNTFNRPGAYTNNINNPLGTVGLTYLNQASTNVAGGSATFTFFNLSGDFTLIVGGNNGAAAGNYTVTLTTTTTVNCLFDWAEKTYSNLFAPAAATNQELLPYTYRYYKDTNTYVGVSSVDSHVYYLGSNGVLQDVGALSSWLTTSGCSQ